MAAPQDFSERSPEVSEVKTEYFGRLTKVSSPLSDLSLNAAASPDFQAGQKMGAEGGTKSGPTIHEKSFNSTPPYTPPPLTGGDGMQSPRPPKAEGKSESRRNTKRSWSSSSLGKLRRLSSPLFASPWEHDPPNPGDQHRHTVKEFNHNLQRQRLFVNSLVQLFITVALCLLLVGTLKGFQTLEWLSQGQKHGFNALVTGLSIALGINLASSLRGYAQMMRWRFLASTYRPLHEFELVMQCESQTKVMSLFWAARTRGRLWLNTTQWLCAAWIFFNVAVQVLIAMIGLTYSVDSSNTWVTTSTGNITIADLAIIRDRFNPSATDLLDQQGAAQEYGVQGEAYGVEANVPLVQQVDENTIYTDNDWDYFFYRFIDKNSNDDSVTIVSSRTINATATCQSFKVTQVGIDDWPNITYVDTTGQIVNFYIGDYATGAITYMGNSDSNCGPRCTEVWALQVADNVTVDTNSFFKCKNTVGLVIDDYYGPTSGVYQMPNEQAQIIAGAIGWSGFYTPGSSFEDVLYSTVTPWSPNYTASAADTAQFISLFSIGAVAAMDDHGFRLNVTSPDDPSTAQIVDVQWKYAAPILAIIPFLQFLGLLAVIHWADRVVIKDDSFLSAARLLRPVVDQLGPHGCLLTGEQIAEELGNIKVRYGYREPTQYHEDRPMVRHLDLIQETEDMTPEKLMPLGLYDGEVSSTEMVRKRKTRRMSF